MIKYNADTNEIQVIEVFSWDGIIGLINDAKEYYKDLYENDELPPEDVENIKKFLDWDPNKDETPLFGNAKTDLMQYLTDEMTNDEWSDLFNAESSIRNALAEWLTGEFDVEMEACEIFPDINV